MATNLAVGMTPQQMFETAVEFEGQMGYIAATLPTPNFMKRERQDMLARIAVASEGVEVLLAEMLRTTELALSLPFREDFESLLRTAVTRTRALQEIILIGDFSQGAMANVSGVVDVNEDPLKQLVRKLESLAAAGALGAFLAELGCAVEEHDEDECPDCGGRWESCLWCGGEG